MDEIVSNKLKEIIEPEAPVVRIITKEAMVKNVEAKEVFDYLYKVRPSFRQNMVENIKVEEGENIKKMFIISKKEGKEHRMVVLKDN